MDVVALLDIQAINTRCILARHEIELFAGVYRVKLLSLDPARSDVILKRFTSREKAEDFLFSLLPKPAATRIDA